jgi:hypothetical protein
MENPSVAPRRILHIILDHNPLFLLSVLCMLAGIYALDQSLAPAAGQLEKILLLLGTLNVYEALLIALAVILLIARPLLRDGKILATLEILFLADATNLNAETIFVSPRIGMLINAIILVLALTKLTILFRRLNLPFSADRFGLVAAQLALLYAMPILFHGLHAGDATPAHAYAIWWLIGLLPVAYHVVTRLRAAPQPLEAPHAIAAIFLAVPYLSLIAHLGFLHWIDGTPFYAADLSPVLLGLTVLLFRSPLMRRLSLSDRRILYVILPATAVLFSINDPFELAIHIGHHAALLPLPLMLLAISSALVYCLAEFLFLPLLAVELFAAFAYIAGPPPEVVFAAIAADIQLVWNGSVWLFKKLFPTTPTAWGALSVVASFVLLILGGAISINRRTPESSRS